MNIRAFVFFAFIFNTVSANTISNIIKREEKTNNIPTGLLAAITKVESSMTPYVINSKTKGSRSFSDITKASTYARNLIRSGEKNFSVGCCQIHYKTHGNKFKSIDDMFNPVNNIKYAAKLLKKLYNEHGTWNMAVMKYHSAKPSLGAKYISKVASKYGKRI